MIALTYVPGPPLADFIDLFWLSDGDDVPHAKERVLPDGATQLIINLRERGFRTYGSGGTNRETTLGRSIVTGPRAEFVVVDAAAATSTIGVHFRPGAAAPFLGAPTRELSDRDVDLDLLWGAVAAAELREPVLDAPTPEAKFRVLEEALLARAYWNAARHPAVTFAMREFEVVPHVHTRPAAWTEIASDCGYIDQAQVQFRAL